MESFFKSKVAVFQNNYDCVEYARQVATVKNLQTDSRPFYVMNVGKVSTLLDVWISVLPRVRPFYAVNCNSDSVLMQVLADKPHVGFYCHTKDNVGKALQFSAPERVFYSNACWTRSTIAHAASNAIGLIAFDNARDLNRIATGYPNAELMLNVCVNADVEDANPALGCSLDEAPELLQLVADMGLNCVGVSFSVGAGINYAKASSIYARAIKDVACLFDYACTRLGMQLNVLNIGGGFSLMGGSAGFQQVSDQINISLDYYFPREFNADLQIIATPGRFFAESIYSLVTNIIGRRSVDASHVTNDDFDTGTEAFIYHTNEGYYGSFGCQIDANCEPQCVPLFDNFMDNVTSEHVYGSVHGPTMDQQFDVLQSLCRFRPLRVGEWLIWSNMGAYTLNNCGNLDDNSSDDYATNSPNIFYFSSHDDWARLQCKSSHREAGDDDENGDNNNNGKFRDDHDITHEDPIGKAGEYDDGFKSGKDAKTLLLLDAVDEDEGIGSGNELDERFLMLDDEEELDDFLIGLDDDIFATGQYFCGNLGENNSNAEQQRKCSRVIKQL